MFLGDVVKKFLIIILLFFLFYGSAGAKIKANITERIPMSASAAILMDKDSGRILYQKNINVRFLTASISKIMTAIIAIEHGDLNEYYKVDEETARQEGSSLYLELEDKVKLIDLLYGLMLRSGNDAAVLIARNVFKDYASFYLYDE